MKRPGNDLRLCITEPGIVRGEAGYNLLKDIKQSKANIEGSLYAMGKTLYQFRLFFDCAMDDEISKKVVITEEEVHRKSDVFRKILEDPNKGHWSRILLTDIQSCVDLSCL